MTKRRILIALIVPASLGVACWWLQQMAAPRPAKFPLAIPASAKLLDSFHHVGAISEHTYAFAFEVTDDELLEQLVSEWELVDRSQDYFSGSFASMTAKHWEIAWWPDQETLVAMPARYEWKDNARQVYRSVYHDEEADRLYVEYGNW